MPCHSFVTSSIGHVSGIPLIDCSITALLAVQKGSYGAVDEDPVPDMPAQACWHCGHQYSFRAPSSVSATAVPQSRQSRPCLR